VVVLDGDGAPVQRRQREAAQGVRRSLVKLLTASVFSGGASRRRIEDSGVLAGGARLGGGAAQDEERGGELGHAGGGASVL
jgi:hypothetical protein